MQINCLNLQYIIDVMITIYVCAILKLEDKITDYDYKQISDNSDMWKYITPLREKQTKYLVKKYGCVMNAVRELHVIY